MYQSTQTARSTSDSPVHEQGLSVYQLSLLAWSSSGSVHVVTLPGYSSQGQTHFRLSQCGIRPPVLAKSADNHGMMSLSRGNDSDLRVVGSPNSGQVCHLHNSHLPKFTSPIPEPQALAVTLAGMVNVHVFLISLV